jgi:hypothetical protein
MIPKAEADKEPPAPTEVAPCPDPAFIVHYYLRNLEEEQQASMDEHLKGCSECRVKLTALVLGAELSAFEDRGFGGQALGGG